MIPDPVAILPFLRINLNALELHAEVNVVVPGHAGLTALAMIWPRFTRSPSCTAILLKWP